MTDAIGPFEKLAGLRGQSVELGLAQITRLLDHLDHPERDFPAIHVAGTNGKGSVAAMVAAMLRRAGHRVGLLTSPHLVEYSERIRVNGQAIREEDAAPIVTALEREDGTFDGSFFEVTTAVAFEHFRRRGVDVGVLEVGLGGRLDATNVCCPRVTAVTSIDLDHVKTLGSDHATIAAEKAGIIKPGIPVVRGRVGDDAASVLEAIATRRGAQVLAVEDEIHTRVLSSSWDGLELAIRLQGGREYYASLPLPGRHQVSNLEVAVLLAHTFESRPGEFETLLAGLEDTHWPGRLQQVTGVPVRVYDVAHNLAGTQAFASALGELGVPDESIVVVGVLGDKDLGGMASELARHFRRAVAVTPPHPLRARPAEETAEALRAAGITATIQDSVAAACDEAASTCGGGWVFVTGSLFTVGAAMEAFGDPAEASGANLASREG